VGTSLGNLACVRCSATVADGCGVSGCTCGGGPPCKDGDECSSGACRCSTKSCKGCCEVLGLFSQCIGTRNAYYCAANDGGGAQPCIDCNAVGMRSDRCSPAGDCACGSGGPCAVGQRCFEGACVTP
jgi:hypothetical protein